MRKLERTIIYTTILLAIGLALGFRGFSSQAVATDTPAPDALIGVVDVIALLEDGLLMEPYAVARQEAGEIAITQLKQFQAQMKSLEDEIKLMDQADPQRSALIQQYQQLSGQYQQLQPQLSAQMEQLSATHAAELYTKILATADLVGSREGYGYVMACRIDGQMNPQMGLGAITQQIIARPLLRGITGNDLTDLVRTELAIPVPPPFDATPPPMPSEIPGMSEPGSMPGNPGDMEPLEEPATP